MTICGVVLDICKAVLPGYPGSSQSPTPGRGSMGDRQLVAAPDSYSYVNTFFECKEGVSIGFLTILILGVLTMWYLLFTKITMGRRKREVISYWEEVAEFATALAYGGEYISSYPKCLCPIL